MRISLRKKLPLNKALKILILTNALILLASSMLGPIYAIFVEEIGGDLLDASLTFAIFSLVSGVTVYISGKYTDKVKREELILVLGYILMGIGFLLYTTVGSVLSLFLVQVVIGLGGAIYSPAFDALYSKHLDEHKEGVEWGNLGNNVLFYNRLRCNHGRIHSKSIRL